MTQKTTTQCEEWLEAGWMSEISGFCESYRSITDNCLIGDTLSDLATCQTQEEWNDFPAPACPTEADTTQYVWIADNGPGWHEVSVFANESVDERHVETSPSQSTDSRPSQSTDSRPSQSTDSRPSQSTDSRPSMLASAWSSKLHSSSAEVSTKDTIGQPHDGNKHQESPTLQAGKSRKKRKSPSGVTDHPVQQRKRSSRSTVTSNQKQRLMEQNRLAALRCRERKHDEARALRIELEKLEDQHRKLSEYHDALEDEVFRLKSQVLEHGRCDCILLRQYIESEALKIVNLSFVASGCSPGTYTTTIP
ncbi:unnamed protein product [Fusarium venenatum]|uniref:BZIP domain-containing protein n=2 Tax=Fusarium venenatum TaxID=56646 RepID=A0A2L2SRM2_9HYPO|nr:uncharacterized protein FVRRES_12511 [Fusarium venenatum]CEI39820.1 unnamed protein product [Fusarium venenatum]